MYRQYLYCPYRYTSDSASDLQCYRYQELPTFARASVQCHGEGSRNQKVCMCGLFNFLSDTLPMYLHNGDVSSLFSSCMVELSFV